MSHLDSVLEYFDLQMKDLFPVTSKFILLYDNDNAIPYGRVSFDDDGKFSMRFGFGTHNSCRTSLVKKTKNGMSFIPTIHNQKDVRK